MIIMGIDPGSSKTGWGIIDSTGSLLKYVDSGAVDLSKNMRFSQKLAVIYKELTGIMGRYRPDQGAVEEVFFSKNAKSALVLGHARGVALLALNDGGCAKIFQYSPRKIKLSVVGVGSADKRQAQHMVKIILGVKKVFSCEDESDALATAICHAYNLGRIGSDAKEL